MKTKRSHCVFAALLLAQSALVNAEALYVTDSITVSLFESSELSGEPKQKLLSGAQVEVLQRKDGIAEVKTKGGNQGWLRTTFLTASTPALLKLERAINKLEQLKRDLDKERKTVAEMKSLSKDVKDVGWMRAEMSKARKKAANLEKKLAAKDSEYKQSSEQAVGVAEQIEQLKAEKAEFEMRLAAVLLINGDAGVDNKDADVSFSWLWSLLIAIVIFIAGAGAGYYWLDQRLTRRFGGVRIH